MKVGQHVWSRQDHGQITAVDGGQVTIRWETRRGVFHGTVSMVQARTYRTNKPGTRVITGPITMNSDGRYFQD